MTFDSYVVQDTNLSLTMPLACTPPRKASYSKGLRSLKGFTLAEVLITLTIIGVVAAMTIPTLMSNQQKHTYVVGLKKAYSTLQNALRMMPINENCPVGDWECVGVTDADNIDGKDFGNNSEKKWIYLLSKQYKVDELNLNCTTSSCKKVDTKAHMGMGVLEAQFKTADGMIFGSYGFGYGGAHGVYVDVNGQKGPNRLGKDQFIFAFKYQDNADIGLATTCETGSLCPFGNRLVLNNTNNGSVGHCNAFDSYEFDGRVCAAKVIYEDAMNY